MYNINIAYLMVSGCIFLFLTVEAIHIGSLIAAQGYLFPISDHVLALKDDGTFFRFQVSAKKTPESSGEETKWRTAGVADLQLNQEADAYIQSQRFLGGLGWIKMNGLGNSCTPTRTSCWFVLYCMT